MRCPQGAGGAALTPASRGFAAAFSDSLSTRPLPAFAASDPSRTTYRGNP